MGRPGGRRVSRKGAKLQRKTEEVSQGVLEPVEPVQRRAVDQLAREALKAKRGGLVRGVGRLALEQVEAEQVVAGQQRVEGVALDLVEDAEEGAAARADPQGPLREWRRNRRAAAQVDTALL